MTGRECWVIEDDLGPHESSVGGYDKDKVTLQPDERIVRYVPEPQPVQGWPLAGIYWMQACDWVDYLAVQVSGPGVAAPNDESYSRQWCQKHNARFWGPVEPPKVTG